MGNIIIEENRMADATFTFRLDNISQLYIAPELNPLSTNELAVVGQSALERVLSRHEITSKEEQIEIMLLLLPDKITPNMEEQIHEAVDKFCLLKRNEELRFPHFCGSTSSSDGRQYEASIYSWLGALQDALLLTLKLIVGQNALFM